MTRSEYRDLLNRIDKIVNDVTALKKRLVLEFRPAPDIKNVNALENFLKITAKYTGKWDEITAVEEVRRQREKL